MHDLSVGAGLCARPLLCAVHLFEARAGTEPGPYDRTSPKKSGLQQDAGSQGQQQEEKKETAQEQHFLARGGDAGLPLEVAHTPGVEEADKQADGGKEGQYQDAQRIVAGVRGWVERGDRALFLFSIISIMITQALRKVHRQEPGFKHAQDNGSR